MKIYLPLDSAAVALGADEIAEALHVHAKAKGIDPLATKSIDLIKKLA